MTQTVEIQIIAIDRLVRTHKLYFKGTGNREQGTEKCPNSFGDCYIKAEERLRQAMLASDVSVLDELLAPDIIITNHLGQLLTKNDDLAAHESGLFKIDQLTPSEQHISIHKEIAIVSVRMQLSGSYNGRPTNGDFRYTRMWNLSERATWQIVAAHIGMIKKIEFES
ncbi:nuclear transport factor 2 family protein [Crocosphaera sp.]|uniref:nuclear transport factor 2 family protein n=1 Tax=Crocosphaera sp. TaxID=2729996 RepID=UPI00260CFF60|nr:nuclear transport factor 2 family protein [Crocosphaera sp.]MDJ0581119.1 nuclear transport factor 2 family protein [Crocosphaera sp.]